MIKKTIVVRGQKIEIEIPASYDLVQDGNKVELVKRDKRSLKWGEKDSELKGYSIGDFSKISSVYDCPRRSSNRNIFAKESQARGSRVLAMLSQQLADFNGGWEPDWEEKEEDKWCIHREFSGDSLAFRVACYWRIYHFLSFKTKEDAEKFLDTNIKEIKWAKDFI